MSLEDEDKTRAGGARPGAGRKPKGESSKIKVGYLLDPNVVEIIRSQPNQAEFIEAAVKEKIASESKSYNEGIALLEMKLGYRLEKLFRVSFEHKVAKVGNNFILYIYFKTEPYEVSFDLKIKDLSVTLGNSQLLDFFVDNYLRVQPMLKNLI